MATMLQKAITNFKNPTPKWAKFIFRTVLFASMLWAFLAPTFTDLSEQTLGVINMWLLRANGIIRISIQFFALDYNPDAQD